MSVMKIIENEIEKTQEGSFFTYKSINKQNTFLRQNTYASSKALSRLCEKGVIKRYKRGVYYKPKNTVLGQLMPSENKQLELLLQGGYLTGNFVYNRWGLTTQISNVITIAIDRPKRTRFINNGKVKIKYVTGIKPKKKKDIQKLQLLDVLKNVKRIPDRDDEIFISTIKDRIINWSEKEIKDLVRLSKNYNPSTRALLGAILELLNLNSFFSEIKMTLNSLTTFNIPISDKALPNKKNWQIV